MISHIINKPLSWIGLEMDGGKQNNISMAFEYRSFLSPKIVKPKSAGQTGQTGQIDLIPPILPMYEMEIKQRV